MRDYAKIIINLRLHAASCRLIGNDTEAASFENKADTVEKSHPPIDESDRLNRELTKMFLQMQADTEQSRRSAKTRTDAMFERIRKDFGVDFETVKKRKKRQ